MTISRKVLRVAYASMSIVALIGCGINDLQYRKLGPGAFVYFWKETLVNPASRSITIDIFFFLLAAMIWMFLEARRLSIGGVWVWFYALFGFFIAISAAFPAFLFHREIALARRDGSASAGTLSVLEILFVIILWILFLAYTFVALPK